MGVAFVSGRATRPDLCRALLHLSVPRPAPRSRVPAGWAAPAMHQPKNVEAPRERSLMSGFHRQSRRIV